MPLPRCPVHVDATLLPVACCLLPYPLSTLITSLHPPQVYPYTALLLAFALDAPKALRRQLRKEATNDSGQLPAPSLLRGTSFQQPVGPHIFSARPIHLRPTFNSKPQNAAARNL